MHGGGQGAGGFQDVLGLVVRFDGEIFLAQIEVDFRLMAVEFDRPFEGLNGGRMVLRTAIEHAQIGMGRRGLLVALHSLGVIEPLHGLAHLQVQKHRFMLA